MGAINYKTSDYITLGIRPYDIDDFTDDFEADFDVISEYISDLYMDDQSNVEEILSKYSFYYYRVKIEPGYYEGFTIDIENNFGICYDSYEDRREAQKEITQLKNMMIELSDIGLVEVWPGWCTTYKNRTETIKAINAAVKDMRNECANIPTWRQYEREAA